MEHAERQHALDAVRAFALLSGIALHAAQPFIAGLPWLVNEPSSDSLAALWYTIHMFRMPVFFLIAGYFGRMQLERRGVVGFIKDRSRRILLPLAVGLPLLMALTAAAFVLGSVVTGSGSGNLQALQPPHAAPHQGWLARVNLIHLWFLYYLALFYAAALLLRLSSRLPLIKGARLHTVADAITRFVLRSGWGPLLLALPLAGYYCALGPWTVWDGLPGPMALLPDSRALVVYGSFFGCGWLLNRQPQLLLCLEKRWLLYCGLAIGMWLVCRGIAGSTPNWGLHLPTREMVLYTGSYLMAGWCGAFALIGAAVRFLPGFSAVRRYLADSSYWLYLLHIPVLMFLEQVLHPLPWHPAVKYLLTISAALPILLLSYQFLVRFTFIGATLNGTRHRPVQPEPPPAGFLGR